MEKKVPTVIHILAVAVNYILCKSYLKVSLLTLIKFYFLLLKSLKLLRHHSNFAEITIFGG